MKAASFLLLLAACASRPPPPSPVAQEPIGVDLTTPPPTDNPPRRAGECTTPDPAGLIVVTLTREPCLGDCPTYQVTVDTRGNVRWRGIEHVAQPITTTAFVPMAPVRALANMIVASCFFEMKDEYSSPGAEGGWAIITVNLGVSTKTVRHQLGATTAPPSLLEIEAKIDEVAQTSRWR